MCTRVNQNSYRISPLATGGGAVGDARELMPSRSRRADDGVTDCAASLMVGKLSDETGACCWGWGGGAGGGLMSSPSSNVVSITWLLDISTGIGSTPVQRQTAYTIYVYSCTLHAIAVLQEFCTELAVRQTESVHVNSANQLTLDLAIVVAHRTS